MGRQKQVPIQLVVGLALVVGCAQAPADFVLVNRTQSTLAFAPGVILEPCTESPYGEQTLRAAADELVDLVHNDIAGDEDAWIPAGAIQWEGIPPRRLGSASPMTYVISGSQPAYVEYGHRVRPLPPCEGQPLLGAEPPH